MSNITGIDKGQERHAFGNAGNSKACPVCDGKGYSLVATKKVNQAQTIFERQDCHLCVSAEAKFSAEKKNEASHAGRTRLSGTGHLRNKKRRRKDEPPGAAG